MRVGLVSFHGGGHDADPGGPAEHVSSLAEALAGHGHDVVHYARRQTDGPAGSGAGSPAGYETVLLPAGPPTALSEAVAMTHLGKYVDRLKGQLGRHEVDVLHCHTWLAGLAAELATQASPVPVAQTFHRLSAPNQTRRGKRPTGCLTRIERTVARHASRIIALSEHERDLLVGVGMPRERVSVVPAGVDTERLTSLGAPVEASPLAHRVVVTGPLGEAPPLLRALPLLPDTELVFIDVEPEDSADRARLATLSAEPGLAGRVRLVRRPDTAQRVALLGAAYAAVCYVAPGQSGYDCLEAMARGVPVVATSPAAREAVVDGVTGIHLEDAGPRLIARGLRELLDNPALSEGMSVAGRDRVASRYNWPRIASECAYVYQELVETARVRTLTSPSSTTPA